MKTQCLSLINKRFHELKPFYLLHKLPFLHLWCRGREFTRQAIKTVLCGLWFSDFPLMTASQAKRPYAILSSGPNALITSLTYVHAIKRQSPLMQSVVCIIYTVRCISLGIWGSREKSVVPACFSILSVPLLHVRAYIKNFPWYGYTRCSLQSLSERLHSTFSTSPVLHWSVQNEMLKTEVLLSASLSRGQFKNYHSNDFFLINYFSSSLNIFQMTQILGF